MTTSPAEWQFFLDDLKGRVQEHAFNTWLKPLTFVACENGCLRIGAPSAFYKQWVEDNYLAEMRKAARTRFSGDHVIDLVVLEEEKYNGASAIADDFSRLDAAEEVLPVLPARQPWTLDPRYTFDRFVVGKANEFAHAASFAVATDPGRTYNPLFIYGGVGLGKTHLLHAIGHLAVERNPSLKVCYISAEKFANEMISCMRHQRSGMHEFKAKYRGVDMLLMDDVQFIAGKQSTQEEFFHTFNELYSTQRQIVVTSDKLSQEIPDLEKRIQSRFEWGLVADIGAPDLETKVAILNRKAETDHIPLTQEVAFFLASTIQTNNIRDLEGALNKLGAHSSLMKKEITQELAREVFASLIDAAPKEVAPELVMKTVAEFHGIKVSDLKSDRKHKVVVMPRQIAMFLLRELTPLSFPDIGQRFGGKDHTTVMYAVKKIEQKQKDDVSLKNTIDTLRRTIVG